MTVARCDHSAQGTSETRRGCSHVDHPACCLERWSNISGNDRFHNN